MRIAILINTFCEGRGMDYVARQHAEELIDSGHEATIFTFYNDHSNIPVEKLNWPKNNTLNLIYRIIFPLDVFKIIKYSKMLRKYDVIISHFYPIHLLAYVTKKRYPKIRYVLCDHGIADNKYINFFERFYSRTIKILTFMTTRDVDIIISISQYIHNQGNTRKARKEIIYNRTSPDKFIYDESCINDNILNIHNEKGPKLLYVGIVTRYKGIELLIRSFNRINGLYPDAKLFLVGKMSYGNNLYKCIDKENVHYFGKLTNSELGFLYNNIDIYVSASTWEGFNLPIVEAQMFGKPVVAFDIGAHKEVIQNGKTGILVKPFVIEKFADAIIYVYKNKKEMGHKAKTWALNFSDRNGSSYNISDLIGTL